MQAGMAQPYRSKAYYDGLLFWQMWQPEEVGTALHLSTLTFEKAAEEQTRRIAT
jgi:hypothetical protein